MLFSLSPVNSDVLSFHMSKYFLISFRFVILTTGYLGMCSVTSTYFQISQLSLWFENTLCTISILLIYWNLFYHLGYHLLETVPSALEKNVYSGVRHSVLHVSARFGWLIVLFKSSVFFLIFCLVLSIQSRTFKVSAIIVELSISCFNLLFLLHVFQGWIFNVAHYCKISFIISNISYFQVCLLV